MIDTVKILSLISLIVVVVLIISPIKTQGFQQEYIMTLPNVAKVTSGDYNLKAKIESYREDNEALVAAILDEARMAITKRMAGATLNDVLQQRQHIVSLISSSQKLQRTIYGNDLDTIIRMKGQVNFKLMSTGQLKIMVPPIAKARAMVVYV